MTLIHNDIYMNKKRTGMLHQQRKSVCCYAKDKKKIKKKLSENFFANLSVY